MLALGLFAVPQISTAVAAGSLYISPATVPNLSVGSTFTVQVKVATMDQFNGWEIQVVSDASVISPVSISTSGNVFQANTTGGIAFEVRNCVNGSGTGCCLSNSCAPVDGVGIADSGYAYTRPVSGSGLLFTVTYQVVSNKPISAISIQNDQFSNGGSSVPHTTVGAQYGSLASIAVTDFFTDAGLNPLPLDPNSNPSLTVVQARNVIRSTNPGEILAWVQVSNTGHIPLQSLTVTDTLPIDWQISPPWSPSVGAIHVYFGNSSSLATNLEITDPSTITVSTSNPEIVSVAIPNFNNTAIGQPLQPGQSILVSVKLSYGLTKTTQVFTSFPLTYTDSASASAFAQPSFTGSGASGTGSAFFVAYLNVVGNPANDSPNGSPNNSPSDSTIVDYPKFAMQ